MIIFALLFNMSGAYLIFESARFNIRKEVKQRIKAGVPADQLFTLRFRTCDILKGTAGIQWKESNEFSYNGLMYDIVKKNIDGEYTIYECINDKQEDQLFAKLDELVKKTTSKNKNVPQRTRIMLQLLIHEAMINEQTKYDIDIQSITFSSNNNFLTRAIFDEVPTPPPNFKS